MSMQKADFEENDPETMRLRRQFMTWVMIIFAIALAGIITLAILPMFLY